MSIIKTIINGLNLISDTIGLLTKYKYVYKITGIFATRKFKKAEKQHKYAVLVAARNEQAVIGNLIDSIKQQDYPNELVTVFVVADNCTDNTAEIARQNGAVCYERFDTEHRTKGFALQYLVECIRKDYGIDAFEGYFIFDADNLLKKDYISRMNESFDAGEKIITSYRNTKNLGDNWISASYAIHWLRTIRNEHRARSLFHLATRIQGTGFLFANELIRDGWNYTSLTEDRAFCADAVVNGYTITYNNAAEFFDEQPVDIKTAMRQRIRWSKGHLQAFTESGPKLFTHVFFTHGTANKDIDKNTASIFRLLINNIRFRFMSFDMLTVIYPRTLALFFKRLLVYILRFSLLVIAGKHFGAYALITWYPIYSILKSSFFNIINAAYVFIMEWKRIVKIKWYRAVWFCVTFPLFDLIGKLSFIIALFSKVEWKPIPHNASISIEQLGKNEKEDKKESEPVHK